MKLCGDVKTSWPLTNYIPYIKTSQAKQGSGVVITAVNKSLPSEEVVWIDTLLQLAIVNIYCKKTIAICDMYIPRTSMNKK